MNKDKIEELITDVVTDVLYQWEEELGDIIDDLEHELVRDITDKVAKIIYSMSRR